ncbi:MAG: WD40 repeat domain-containing protein, partial [Anaerolineales bacterium]|nr:WD40 repeat domain-containing protein [Anaerolineales bacterium]
RLWEINPSTKASIVLREHEDNVTDLAFSRDGKWLATGSGDRTVRVWNMNDLAHKPIVLEHENNIEALAFSSDSKWLATITRGDIKVRLWTVDNLTQTFNQKPFVLKQATMITSLAFSPDSRWLATASGDRQIHLWDIGHLQDHLTQEPVVLPNEGGVGAWAFSPDGRRLAILIGDSDNEINRSLWLWDLTNKDYEVIKTPRYEGEGNFDFVLEFSPNGKWLASSSGGWIRTPVVRLWDTNNLTNESPMLVGPDCDGYTMIFSPHGNWLAILDACSYVQLWDMNDPTNKPITLPGRENTGLTLAFSPDETWLAGMSGSSISLWDLNNLTLDPLVVRAHEGDIDTLAFSTDGKWLATGGQDNTVRLWDMARITIPPLEQSCSIIGRNFTRSEWVRYFPGEFYKKTCERWPVEMEVYVMIFNDIASPIWLVCGLVDLSLVTSYKWDRSWNDPKAKASKRKIAFAIIRAIIFLSLSGGYFLFVRPNF